jgi:hypothetical protein
MRKESIWSILLLLLWLFPYTPGTGTRQGSFNLTANSGMVKSLEAIEGIHVECSFSSHPNSIDFAVIRSDLWDLVGTPNRTLCMYFVTATAGSCSFDVLSNSTWYLYFRNDNGITQDITWRWNMVTQEQAQAGFLEYAIASLIVVCFAIFLLLRYYRKR